METGSSQLLPGFPECKSKEVLVFYLCYTLAKIISIAIILILLPSDCGETIDLFLIIYSIIEAIEFIFLCSLLIRKCFRHAGRLSPYFVRSIQLSYESFRFIMVIALSAGLTGNSSCWDKPTGILGTILINIGYIKVLAGLIYTAMYFKELRNLMSNPAPPTYVLTAEQLETYMKIPQKEGLCSICLDEIKADVKCIVLPCEHNFHVKCLKDWVSVKGICPMCRMRLN
ncbi:unnamed protein product [Blepharisma stoltei]|uniref:RING-type domain-containing protein n=1 Tax=Blepharisma stoltei TaxID=1481888 RepID=A0AAU9ISE5_9CILI|nr:unnamed protein product [Blepharisma stoltei]